MTQPELNLEDLNRRLAQIQDRLLATPSDAFAEKYELQRERDRLRKLARRYAADHDTQRDSEEIRAEIDALRARVVAIEDHRVNTAAQAGGGGGGAGSFEGPLDGLKLNWAFDEAHGIGAITNRIARLETILAERKAPGSAQETNR